MVELPNTPLDLTCCVCAGGCSCCGRRVRDPVRGRRISEQSTASAGLEEQTQERNRSRVPRRAGAPHAGPRLLSVGAENIAGLMARQVSTYSYLSSYVFFQSFQLII